MIKKLIQKLSEGEHLSATDVELAVSVFAENKATQGQIGAFLLALKLKGETSDEVTAFAKEVRKRALKIELGDNIAIADSCGTGGDCIGSFNISTASAILASAAGANIVKHSNFGFTSGCGSSNVIEALGINLVKAPTEAKEMLKKHNISFIHAPFFHKCTASVNPVRKEIGVRTIFNFLGPLTNPASPTGHLLGVSNPTLLPKIAEALKNIGVRRALVVCGEEHNIDEMSILGNTNIYRLENDKIENIIITPEDFGMKRAGIEEIKGGSPEFNAKIIQDIFTGEIGGAKADVVVLNTGGLLWCGEVVNSLEEGVAMAYDTIASGNATKKLNAIQA